KGFVIPNRLAGLELERLSQLLQETEHFCWWRHEKVAKIVPYAPPFINKLAVLTCHSLSGVSVGEPLTTSSSLAIKSTVCFLTAGERCSYLFNSRLLCPVIFEMIASGMPFKNRVVAAKCRRS